MALQAPLSMGFSGPEYWSGLPFPFPNVKDGHFSINYAVFYLLFIHITIYNFYYSKLQWSYSVSSVTQSCLTLCNLMDCSMPGFPVHHHSWSLLKLMSIEFVMPSNHLILCCPLLLLSSIFPSIRVFSNESVLHIKWPNYWSFSFSIRSSNE